MHTRWLPLLLLALPLTVLAQPSPEAPAVVLPMPLIDQDAPVDERHLALRDLAPEGLELSGLNPTHQLEFGVRGDRLVTQASLTLDYTPSPSLLSDVSHIKVYLNDELMGTVPLDPSAPGNRQQQHIVLDPRLVGDFNRLRLELVGHYTQICEDPAHTSLWVNINGASQLSLTQQTLPLTNDLSRLPRPFFDPRDSQALTLPIVLPSEPGLAIQRAGGIVASWFGTQAAWRGQRFPVSFDAPPRQHAVVLATNAQRPNVLDEYPAVDGPTIEIISHPDTPYAKLLLVLGRDTDDLVEAAQALALGEVLLRGQSARVDALDTLDPRQPYDAPTWVPTDRPVRFGELLDYPSQLQTQGRKPAPVTLDLRIPPDLFLWQDERIELGLAYRYSPPVVDAGSRLDVSINGEFLKAMPLDQDGTEREHNRLQVPIIEDWFGGHSVAIPAFKLGALNQLRFDFTYANRVGGASPTECRNVIPVAHQAGIDENSTIDFTGYPHYLSMPALRTFANAGFPFSRLADLSQTLVVMPETPSAETLTTLFDTLGRIGAQTGYPGVAVRLTDDWSTAREADADVLAFGSLPESLGDKEPVMALGSEARSRLRLASIGGTGATELTADSIPADRNVAITAHGPIAAILQMQSPFFDQRSIVALLAEQPADHRLLNSTLGNPAALARIRGSVAVIREGGITTNAVGERYHVGHLPWTTWVWYHLSTRPWLMAGTAVLAVLLVAFLLWRILRRLSARRLTGGE